MTVCFSADFYETNCSSSVSFKASHKFLNIQYSSNPFEISFNFYDGIIFFIRVYDIRAYGGVFFNDDTNSISITNEHKPVNI